MNSLQKINNSFKRCFDKATSFKYATTTSDIDKEASDLITKTIPRELASYLNNNDYIVNGSVGKGLATRSPWIAILDKNITTSTREGVYIVFLFSSDYKHVYLALSQGTTVPGQFGPRLGKKEIANNTNIVRDLLKINNPILKADSNADIADVRYKTGAIYYTLWNVDDDTFCEKVLSLYLDTYQKYKELMMFLKSTKEKTISIKNESNIVPKFLPYLTALRTKPFMLLAGISGTGKSRIVREMAKACWKEGDEEYGNNNPKNFCMVQVKPNWHDSSELIGYVSRINGEKYVVGPFLRFLAKAIKNENTPYFLCLDEMNLAPVEQYFAEYLSVIESRKLNADGNITTDPIIPFEDTEAYGTLIDQLFDTEADRIAYKSKDGKRLTIPQNLFVVGTVNMDETTFSFSRKVLDRAMTIEMNEVNLSGGLEEEGSEIGYIGNCIIGDAAEGKDVYSENKDLCDKVIDYLGKVNDALEGTPFKIAYRTRNEFLLYAVNRQLLDKDSQLWQTLDEMTSMKILSRIEGDNDRTKTALERLEALVEKEIAQPALESEEGKEKHKSITAAKIKEMLDKLEKTSYTSYWA